MGGARHPVGVDPGPAVVPGIALADAMGGEARVAHAGGQRIGERDIAKVRVQINGGCSRFRKQVARRRSALASADGNARTIAGRHRRHRTQSRVRCSTAPNRSASRRSVQMHAPVRAAAVHRNSRSTRGAGCRHTWTMRRRQPGIAP